MFSVLCLLLSVLTYNIALDGSLVNLDKHLTSLLVNPQPGKGPELLSDSEILFKKLDEVLDLVDEKNPEGTEMYNKIANAGGLKFINTSYSPELLKDKYKFSDEDLLHLSTNIRESESIWKCIGILLNVTLPDSGEHAREKWLARIRENEILRGEPETNDTSSFGPSELYDD